MSAYPFVGDAERLRHDAVGLAHVWQLYHRIIAGKEASLKQSLDRTLVASIGPVCSVALRKLAVRVDIEAKPPKLGPFIEAMNAALSERRPLGKIGLDDGLLLAIAAAFRETQALPINARSFRQLVELLGGGLALLRHRSVMVENALQKSKPHDSQLACFGGGGVDCVQNLGLS